ncbi:signal recognition particle protein [Gulosibacter macacae]|uniref:Signal recognition particle protein n=1 Tax=Gulosibacter macacae TaxID=2488791 RepID=A0A3P3VUV2_9MICO|nr:signal recognition particle protein [Gulosibacter macacae]RRJ86107.1 signal recognition particle protein [Gulosibacter macacae]
MAMFGNLSDRLVEALGNLRAKGKLTPADVDGTVREIRRALLEADVALPVVKDFVTHVRERALSDDVNRALNPAQQVVQIVNDELVRILGGTESRQIAFAKQPPTVIMLVGLQGAGKTTLAGKLAKWFVGQKHSPMLVAADLQRPNAVTQLRIVGDQAGVPVFSPEPGNGVGDPVRVARESMRIARDKQHDIVIVDTAGRLGVDEALMKQAADIKAAVNPDEVFFVIDSMIGQDAVATAKAFHDGVGFTGAVLTKLDADTRGGAALSVAQTTGQPIMFASVGEKLDDFEVFHPDRMASRILNMGDVLTLIEQAQAAFDEAEAREAAEKLAKDQFTLNDFLKQMQQLRRAGNFKKMIGLMPGITKEAKAALDDFDESSLVRIEAIIQSMTPLEREMPKVLNGSRRARIARGSGTSVTEVNNLVKQFDQMSKMMRTMARGAMPGMPGMGPLGGGAPARGAGKKAKTKGKKFSGNPAKRSIEPAAPQAPSGASFGAGAFGGGAGGQQPTPEELEKLQRFLKR